jgi:hypothetical protein
VGLWKGFLVDEGTFGSEGRQVGLGKRFWVGVEISWFRVKVRGAWEGVLGE